MPLPSSHELTELTDREYRLFLRLDGDAIYHAPPTEFLGYYWDTLLGVVDDEVYKLTASIALANLREADEVVRSVFAYCKAQLGDPSDERQDVSIWDLPDGNIILTVGSLPTHVGIGLHVTSSLVREKAIH